MSWLTLCLLASTVASAHPGNVIATLSARPDGDQVLIEAVLTFDGTGEPLLGATLSWSEAGPGGAEPDPEGTAVRPANASAPIPFRFGGGPNVRAARLPKPRSGTAYTLHILSLGETTEGRFELTPRGEVLEVSPRELLLVFPDVGLPDYQLALVIVLVVLGMVVIIGRGPDRGAPRREKDTS